MVDMDTLISLCKRRGFIFPGSEIYGGLANSWDYGPLGTELKNNIRDWWWSRFVRQRDDMVGIDAAILMNPKVWEASGHVASFNDALIDCKKCRARHRADHLIEGAHPQVAVEGKTPAELTAIIEQFAIACPGCGSKNQFTPARTFNLLFETSMGAVEGEKSAIYLRGELAQAMFVDFKNVLATSRKRVPFGIASVGKVFRNEITPGNFTFRTLEFDLMEFEYFIRENGWNDVFEYWLAQQKEWLTEMGFDLSHTRVREHSAQELSHYSKRTADIEYNTPFGWKEMFGLAYRTDFDLLNHTKHSGDDLRYTDPESGEKFIPHVIEPTFGLTRLTLMTMLEAYHEEEVPTAVDGENEKRIVMKFHPRVAPFKVAVLPLSKKEELAVIAKPLAQTLRKQFAVDYDETQSIGKRYRRQDEIGTPYCVTVDFDSINDKKATIRDRDTMKQERIALDEIPAYLTEKLSY